MIRHIRRALTLAAFGGLLAGCGDDSGGNGPSVPPAPTGLTAVPNAGGTAIDVSWTAVSGATGYRLERADPSNPGVFTQIGGVITATNFSDATVVPNTVYSYRVAASNSAGQGAFSSVVTQTLAGLKQRVVNSDVLADQTWFADSLYILSGYVKVRNNAVLTIQAGTRIVGDTLVNGSSLWIRRGSQLIANGTSVAPIVFTSARSAGNRKPGDWGGIIIIGNGIINRTGNPVQIGRAHV